MRKKFRDVGKSAFKELIVVYMTSLMTPLMPLPSIVDDLTEARVLRIPTQHFLRFVATADQIWGIWGSVRMAIALPLCLDIRS